MIKMTRCPLTGEKCSKAIVVQEKTFFLAEPDKPEEDRERRRNVLDAILGSEYIIRSAFEEKQYAFTCKLCEVIQSCAYGIADVKNGNYNVLMELGMMIALGKPVIVLCKKGGEGLKLAPDARAIRIIYFEEYADLIKPLREIAAKLPAPVSLTGEVKQALDEYGDSPSVELDKAGKEVNLDTGLPEEEQMESSELTGGLDVLEDSSGLLEKSDFTMDADTALSRGNLYYQRGEYEQAIENYDWALTLNPELLEAWNGKGLALGNLDQYEEALECFDKAMELKPDDSDAWLNKGIIAGSHRRYKEARDYCDKAIELRADNCNAWFNKGVALINLAQNEEALECFDKAIELKPDYHEAWSNKSVILINLGRYEEALACCDRAIEIKPDDNNIWFNKWIALGNLGRYDEAIECYGKAIDR